MQTSITPTCLTDLPGMALHFWCRADHVRGVAVADLLALSNPPKTTVDALRRAVCRECGGRAVEFRIAWNGKHTMKAF